MKRQLVVISDFQRAGWNRSSRENVIGKDVKTEMVNLGVENSKNVGIDNVSVDATSFTRTFGGRVIGASSQLPKGSARHRAGIAVR